LYRQDSQRSIPDLIRYPASFAFGFLAAHLRVLHGKGGKLFLQVGIQREHAAFPILAGVNHGFQLKHRQ